MNEVYSHIEKYEIIGIAVKKRRKKKNKEYRIKLYFEPSIKCPANFDDNIFKKQLVCDNRLEIYNATVQEPPPLPYNLNDILNEMLNGWNIKKNDTYQILQKLHKEYKCITNPNTNCRYLSTGQWIDVKNQDIYSEDFFGAMPFVRGRAINDDKTKNGTGISPTQTNWYDIEQNHNVTYFEELIYNLIYKRFAMQFHQPAEYKIAYGEIPACEYGRLVYKKTEAVDEEWKEAFDYPRLGYAAYTDFMIKNNRIKAPNLWWHALKTGTYRFKLEEC